MDMDVDAPKKIWASVNGASTRLPDGVRQFVGGWSEDPNRPRVTAYVRGDLHDDVEQELAAVRHALKIAWGHIEHMAAFIGDRQLGYSFESLGEDQEEIRRALRK